MAQDNPEYDDPWRDALGREMSARTIMFHEAVAARVGLSATEHKCLDLLMRAGEPITAGQLADLSGLTTGAITGIVDRLERAGFVRRRRSKSDRRQVLLYLQPLRQKEYVEPLEALGRAVAELEASYTEQELAIIHDYMERAIEILKEQTARLKEEASQAKPDAVPRKRRSTADTS